MLTMRVLFKPPDGTPWQPYDGERTMTPLGSLPFAQCWPGPHHVLFGHDSKRRRQLAPYATGVDTGCVYGGQLSACVLPPLVELRKSAEFVRKLAGGQPLTLEDLQGEIVSVPSSQPPLLMGL